MADFCGAWRGRGETTRKGVLGDFLRHYESVVEPLLAPGKSLTSVDVSNPAKRGRLKTGQRAGVERRMSFTPPPWSLTSRRGACGSFAVRT
jgi:hypothetical protein